MGAVQERLLFRKNAEWKATLHDLSAAGRCALVLFVLFLKIEDALDMVMGREGDAVGCIPTLRIDNKL
jgi:hypothetical protein